MFSVDMVDKPNQYGVAAPEMIREFELRAGSIPLPYKSFLQECNGANFKNDVVLTGEHNERSYRVHHMFGLHLGPASLRLQDCWNPQGYKDLDDYVTSPPSWIVIGECSTSEPILLSVLDGRVFVVSHSTRGKERFGWEPKLELVGTSFDDFCGRLTSKEAFINEQLSEAQREDFEARVRALRNKFENE